MPGGGGGGGSRRRGRRNRVLVPQARAGLESLKMEAAQALGMQMPSDGYYGFIAARETGALGGYMVKNMIASAEAQLSSQLGGPVGGQLSGR